MSFYYLNLISTYTHSHIHNHTFKHTCRNWPTWLHMHMHPHTHRHTHIYSLRSTLMSGSQRVWQMHGHYFNIDSLSMSCFETPQSQPCHFDSLLERLFFTKSRYLHFDRCISILIYYTGFRNIAFDLFAQPVGFFWQKTLLGHNSRVQTAQWCCASVYGCNIIFRVEVKNTS